MVFKRTKTLFGRNLFFSAVSILIIGLSLILVSYFIQKNVMTNSIGEQSKGLAHLWVNTFDVSDIEKVVSQIDNPDEKLQQKLTEKLSFLSNHNTNVAQAYIFGVPEENNTAILAVPQHIWDVLAEYKLGIGDMYEQPTIWISAANKLLETKKPVNTEVYTDDYGTWITTLEPILNENGEVIAIFGVDIDASYITKGQNELVTNVSIALAILLFVVFIIQYITLRKLLSPVKTLFHGITKVRDGDLNVKLDIKRNDDIGQLSSHFNEMVVSIKEMLTAVNQTAEMVAASSKQLVASALETTAASSEIAKSIKSIASGAELQESNVTQNSKAIEGITVGVNRIAGNIQIVSESSNYMKEKANEGDKSLEKVINQMNLAYTTVSDTSQLISLLGQRSREIGHTVQVISEIAAQTNLLSLNASIEAARAGEHGKGFSIVATEVRKLAEQSEQSAKEISQIVSQIQSDTLQAVKSMIKGNLEVERGVNGVKETKETFDQIVKSIQVVSEQVHAISTVAEEISSSTLEVNDSVQELLGVSKEYSITSAQIASATEEQVATMEEMTSASNSLGDMANELQNRTSRFKI
jgi:methyl-accepting chemotaxis protein